MSCGSVPRDDYNDVSTPERYTDSGSTFRRREGPSGTMNQISESQRDDSQSWNYRK